MRPGRVGLCSLLLSLVLPACGENEPTSPSDDSEQPDSSEDSAEDSAEDTGGEDSTVLPVDADGDGSPADVDCDDADPSVHPGASEACDGRDEDCDGLVDEDLGGLVYADVDGDGYGDAATAQVSCAPASGWVVDAADCDDSDAAVSPSAAELCDGIDNDCDGSLDEGEWSPGVYRNLDETDLRLEALTEDSELGSALVDLGDLDGDGASELVVGAYSAEGPRGESGAVYLLSSSALASASGAVSIGVTTITIWGESDEDEFGRAAVALDDVEGDGLPDLAVAAPRLYASGSVGGSVYVFLSSGALATSASTLYAEDADIQFHGSSANQGAGLALASGDLDGDGLSDLVMGAPYDDDGWKRWAGFTYIALSSGVLGSGSTSLSFTDADIRLAGEAGEDYTGATLAVPGDMDGDGLDDLAIASPESTLKGVETGMVYLLLSSGALARTRGQDSVAVADMRAWGKSSPPDLLAAVGDLEGDGLADLAIGSPTGKDLNGESDGRGHVSVLLSSGQLKTGAGDLDLLTAEIRINGESSADRFGTSITGGGDLDGDGRADLVVGAPKDTRSGSGGGTAFVLLSSGALSATSGQIEAVDADLMLAGSGTYAYAGQAVSMLRDQDGDGLDELVVAAPSTANNPADWSLVSVQSGQSVVELLTAECGVPRVSLADAELRIEGLVAWGKTGESLGILDDLDGDGLDEVVVGAYWVDAPHSRSGAVYIFLSGGALASGAASLTVDKADITVLRDEANALFGQQILTPGDIDGDGRGDLVVLSGSEPNTTETASVFYSSGALSSGASTVYATDADVTLVGIDDGIADFDGIRSLSGAGDVDGDGLVDLLFGSPSTWSNGASGGRAYLFLTSGALADGQSSYTMDDADHRFKGEGEDDGAGRAVAAAGDVDGDGLGDILVSAQLDGVPTVYLVLTTGALAGADRTIELSTADVRFEVPWEDTDDAWGYLVATAADLDGDGLSDLLLDASFDSSYAWDAGAVYLYLSSGALATLSSVYTPAEADLSILGERVAESLGTAIAVAEDLDGDGLPDIVLGAPTAHDAGQDAGAVVVFTSSGALASGSSTLLRSDADLTLLGEAASEYAGTLLCTGGDVDGDGLEDVIVNSDTNIPFGDAYGGARLVTSTQMLTDMGR